jgi:UDP-3-O-[3-hydroxymyristoyl] glucosamine N-acyltransferase
VKLTARQLAEHLKGELLGDGAAEVDSVHAATHARPGSVTFAEDAKRLEQAITSGASAVITFAAARNEQSFGAARLQGRALICVANPRVAFAQTLNLFFPPHAYTPGVHPTAVVGLGVQLGADAHIGPYVVIGNNVKIGARTALEAGVCVGEGTTIGDDCVIYPRVTIYPRVVLGNRVIVHAGAVIGSDGFGYVTEKGTHVKIPQVGNVIIGDHVEIGANTTVDRATLGSTVIKRGTKIDNLVQIAHNDTVGEHCLIAGQVGIAGSATLGDYVMMGGQSGVVDHVTVGDQTAVGGQAMVIGDLPRSSVVSGSPAQPHRSWLRQLAALRRLPEIIKLLTQKGLLAPAPDEEKKRSVQQQ